MTAPTVRKADQQAADRVIRASLIVAATLIRANRCDEARECLVHAGHAADVLLGGARC